MRHLIIFMFTAFVMNAGAVSSAGIDPDDAVSIGTGQASCGAFMEYRKSNNSAQQNLYVQWVWGFLSAYNLRGSFGAQYHRQSQLDSIPDSGTVLLYLETHCRKRPLDTLMDGTFALIKELHGPVYWEKAKQ